MMRFDEFVAAHDISVSPVDQFDGFSVEVKLPSGWELCDATPGIRVWLCRTDPFIETLCANAILTMHRVEASLDAGEIFTMLCEQQRQAAPESRVLHQEFAAATEGVGIMGVLEMQVNHELGTIDSVSLSRIIATEKQTLIAQLTLTALHESPADWRNARLSVRAGGPADEAPARLRGGTPVGRV